MSTKPISTAAFGDKTGRDWAGWLAFLERIGARDLSHTQIAEKVAATGDASPWWAQSITVAFEQHIGRRKPGQRNSGAFEVSANRTVAEDRTSLFARVAAHLGAAKSLGDVAVGSDARTSITPKRSYWRATLADGSTVQLAAEPKGDGKTMLNVTHMKLGAEADVARWRAFWKDELGKF
ncbi:MAG: hypothetical protein KF849_12460 [Rhizobiaceae bacterium]|nr:hypothetical protein [Rhizobiaceae bacterium]